MFKHNFIPKKTKPFTEKQNQDYERYGFCPSTTDKGKVYYMKRHIINLERLIFKLKHNQKLNESQDLRVNKIHKRILDQKLKTLGLEANND